MRAAAQSRGAGRAAPGEALAEGGADEGGVVMESVDRLRKHFDDCTQMAGVENKFEVVYITKSVAVLCLDEIEAEVAERYMELPVDADGVPICPGDELCGYDRPGGGVFAKALSGTMVLVGERDEHHRSWRMWRAADCRHQPDSWERIVEDAFRLGFTGPDNDGLKAGIVARCEALAGGSDAAGTGVRTWDNGKAAFDEH